MSAATQEMPGLALWYRAIKAGWTCPPALLQTDEAWKASARAHLAARRRQVRR